MSGSNLIRESLKSINYFITRTCNYKCGFCFHTAKNSFNLELETAIKGMKILEQAGMKKINFAGGEPFILHDGHFLGMLARYCKQDLGIESVSIISNGSRITEEWMKEYGADVDILGVSCDSFVEETNIKIGRLNESESKRGREMNHIEKMLKIREWCTKYRIAFKLNTVVNSYNWQEDMNENLLRIDPVRWKVF